ncbi:hypothetical protein [Polynucleobacter sp. AP-RePozz3-80-G7]|uniref:hypothetical protein n=1 Tax=Polynucleobacter sp. AP-RePozz3-80-G7 TaxID=2689105 RepID=UPI001C0D645A|nr:hypothetical protein [Polynucleobacter sp. AP-RePozz3-80-G7]MBU3639984.1 hypothetical protein [Polynucleobacter sp. AP-RePozz3-80-G7]
MNNEPVAWIANDADLPLKEDGNYWLYPENPSKDNLYIPLYTHPVKELTDEEMYELLEKYQGIELCKAVLKKAQEK